jgi:Ca2+-binding RTX toxin-like protein
MVSGVVSVPSYRGPLSFTVTGQNTLYYAQQFADALNNALTQGTLGYNNPSDPTATIPGYTPPITPTVTETEISGTGSYTLPPDSTPGSVYTFDDANGPVTIFGSGGTGDDVLVAGINAATTYDDRGGSNLITFVDGDNTYNGDSTSSAGFDTIIAGSGFDSIYTGAGSADVFSGEGDALIVLQDTAPAGATSDPTSVNLSDYNQFVRLDDGFNTVVMNGVADVVWSDAPDQTIFGGSGIDVVALVPPTGDSVATGDDTVVGGSGRMSVYDDSNGNVIYGGSGTLIVGHDAGIPGIEVTVVAGSGSTVVYGEAGDTISYLTTDSTGSAIFVGSSGESVDASGSTGSLTMVLGTGNETLIGGSGPTMFNANYDSATGLTGTITINDFGGSDVFDFVGYTAAQASAIATSGTQTSSGYQITLTDGTKVTFAGITSISGHYTSS